VPSCHVQYVGREPSGILPQHTYPIRRKGECRDCVEETGRMGGAVWWRRHQLRTRRQQRRSPRPHLRCLPSRCAKHGAHQLCTLGKWSSILHRGVEGQGDRSRIRCQFTCWVSLNSQSQFVGVLVLVLDVIAVRLVEVELHAWCKCVCVVCRRRTGSKKTP